MALDFPSSPTNGQIYSNYYYDSTTGAWRSNAPLATGVPLGGAAGTFLAKTSSTDYATAWVDFPSPNYIINSAFDFWQRGTTFSSPANAAYTADRWRLGYDGTGAARTLSRQAFTPGTAPVAGYEGTYFYRYAQTSAGSGATYSNVLEQAIEGVRTLAGQTVTVSFWAKADSARIISPIYTQYFGTGGSPSSPVYIGATSQNITTSWARYSTTITLPSISGKTIGTNGNDSLTITFQSYTTNATQTIDFWGIQVEAGSTATPFRRNSPNLQAELAACQRYYAQSGALSSYSDNAMLITARNSPADTGGWGRLPTPVPMRVQPTVAFYSFSGTASRISVGATGAGDSTYTVSNQLGNMFVIAAGTASNTWYANWTATAEL